MVSSLSLVGNKNFHFYWQHKGGLHTWRSFVVIMRIFRVNNRANVNRASSRVYFCCHQVRLGFSYDIFLKHRQFFFSDKTWEKYGIARARIISSIDSPLLPSADTPFLFYQEYIPNSPILLLVRALASLRTESWIPSGYLRLKRQIRCRGVAFA